MTIQDLGSIGELVGSIAVLISLVYVAIQIRHNTEVAKTSTYQAIVSEFGALNRAMAESPELPGIFVNGLEDFESLTTDERARISQVFFGLYHNFENIFYQYRKGYLEDEVWLGWKRLMLAYYLRPGFQTWWAIRSDLFSSSFVEFLHTEKLDKPVASYYEVTQARRNIA